MRKKMIALMTAGCMVFCVCGCGNTETVSPGTTDIPIIIEEDDAPNADHGNADHADADDTGVNDNGMSDAESDGTGSDTSDAVEPAIDSAALSFTEFKNLTFEFSSGAGGWATQLSIHSDGTFAGEYFDSDMGSYDESHPNGTAYQCNFDGQFSQPVKVNDYTYSMQILSISYAKEPDTSEIKDGTLYYYTTPYGLDGAETLLIYLPGAPLAELPEGYRSWVGYYYLENTTDTELPFYGLYNEAEAEGFSSYSEWESLKYNVEYIEEQAAIIEDALINDGTLSQGDLNVKSGELYALWDSMLNIIWKSLRRVNDADTMRALTDEQLKWIAEKEQAVQEAGAEVEGGSLYPLITNTVAADMTKARVYELLALLEP
ncbi:MAG: DUF1311 domain-containing protein [Lachnospiraceae bacterium]|nr:DUF1311 domain-containing protein [Lachnospiraceae bacterium]